MTTVTVKVLTEFLLLSWTPNQLAKVPVALTFPGLSGTNVAVPFVVLLTHRSPSPLTLTWKTDRFGVMVNVPVSAGSQGLTSGWDWVSPPAVATVCVQSGVRVSLGNDRNGISRGHASCRASRAPGGGPLDCRGPCLLSRFRGVQCSVRL